MDDQLVVENSKLVDDVKTVIASELHRIRDQALWAITQQVDIMMRDTLNKLDKHLNMTSKLVVNENNEPVQIKLLSDEYMDQING